MYVGDNDVVGIPLPVYFSSKSLHMGDITINEILSV